MTAAAPDSRRGTVVALVIATVLLGFVLELVSCRPDALAEAPGARPTRSGESPTPPSTNREPGLHGRVLDDLGIPIANVAVRAQAASTGSRFEPDRGAGTPAANSVVAITDAGGIFQLTPPPGDLILVARHPLFATRLRHARYHPGRVEDIGEWILPARAGLLVEVRGATDTRLPGALVRIEPRLRHAEQPDPTRTTTARTDATGIATFYGVPPGPWTVTVTARGRATTVLTHRQPETPEASPHALVTLARGHTLTGRLRTADGDPVAGALVIATRDPGGSSIPQGPSIETRTDAAGAFRLEGLGHGQQQILVLSDTHGFLRREDVDPDAGVLPLRLRKGLEIHGRVLDGRTKRPLPGAIVTLRAHAGWPAFRHGRIYRPHATTDAAGKFRFRGLSPGIHSLRAESKGLCPATAGPLAPTAPSGSIPSSVTLVLEEGFRVTGQILSPAGLPLEDAVIHPSPQPADVALSLRDRSSTLVPTATVRSQTGGRFEIKDLLPGRYRIEVAAPDLPVLRTVAFTARPKAHLDLGSIRLRRGGTVHGTAMDVEGRPASFATVHLRPKTGPDLPTTNPSCIPRAVQADAKGRFHLPPVPSGSYRVFYDYPDRQTPRAAAESRALTSVSVEVADRTNQTKDLRPRVR